MSLKVLSNVLHHWRLRWKGKSSPKALQFWDSCCYCSGGLQYIWHQAMAHCVDSSTQSWFTCSLYSTNSASVRNDVQNDTGSVYLNTSQKPNKAMCKDFNLSSTQHTRGRSRLYSLENFILLVLQIWFLVNFMVSQSSLKPSQLVPEKSCSNPPGFHTPSIVESISNTSGHAGRSASGWWNLSTKCTSAHPNPNIALVGFFP